jgi:uncharacterized protein YjbI with pentapeptide repeats
MPSEKRNIIPSDIPKNTVLKTCEFANAVFVEDAVFAEKTFDCFADFSNAEFQGEVDFSKAVFLKGVSFKGAKFFCNGKNVSFEEAFFLPSENNIDFSNAHFGNPYHLELDGWRISFQLEIENNEEKIYHLIRSKKEAGKTTTTETLRDFKEEGLADFLKPWEMQDQAEAITKAFKIFCGNPNTVSFARCQFGEMDFPELNEEELKNIKIKLNQRFSNSSQEWAPTFEAFYAKKEGLSIAEKQKQICELVYATDEKKRNLEGANTLFAVAKVLGVVLERDQLLPLIRGAATHVDFSNSKFSNQGDAIFYSANFSNGESVDFNSAKFLPQKELYLNQVLWLQNGDLDFQKAEFRETLDIKFDECLFMPGGYITFNNTRFPEKGSLMWQRCYFAMEEDKKIDFSECVFRHTLFSGGTITWLKEEEGKYDSLPQQARQRIEAFKQPLPLFSRIFSDNSKVLWSDLTTESAKHLTFLNTNLSHSLFNGMTLSHIQLNACHWQGENKQKPRLYYEETLKKDASESELRQLEDQNTQLKSNLERQGSYLQAGYFHRGEQETRQKIRWRKKNYSLWFFGALYGFFSDFGEAPMRTVLMTLASILLLTSFNLYTKDFLASVKNQAAIKNKIALKSKIPGKAKTQAVNNIPSKTKLQVEGTPTPSESPTAIFKTFVQTVSPFSWKSIVDHTTFTSTNVWRYAVFFIWQVFILAIQIPLTVMTVRRHFKR